MTAFVNHSIWRLETTRPGKVVFGAGASGEICCFDVQTAAETLRCDLRGGWINGLAYSAQTDLLAAATSRGRLFALDASTLHTRASLSLKYWLNGMKCLGNNSYLATTAEGGILLWDASSNDFTLFKDRHFDQVWDCAVTKNGQLAATVGGDGELALWRIPKRELVSRFSKGGYTLTAVVMLESRGLIATVDMGGVLTFWAIKSGRPICRLNAHDTRIWSMAVSDDERRIVTAGADRRVVVWDVETLRILHEHRLNSIPTACKIHTPSRCIVVGDRAGTISLLDGGPEPDSPSATSVATVATIESNRAVAFINGQADGKQGTYSVNLLEALNKSGVAYAIVDVANSPLRRQSLARLCGCPLFPQLYIDGKFVGGSEVVCEMIESGAFHRLFKIPSNRRETTI